MSNEAQRQHSNILRARRSGIPSDLDATAPFETAKPEFYADARGLIDDVGGTYESYVQAFPPYGLVGRRGEALASLSGTPSQQWMELEAAMARTATLAFNETTPRLPSCPYHEALRNLGSTALTPIDHNDNGIDRLREITVPGAAFAPATIVNILRHIPAMAAAAGATDDIEAVARASAHSLLHEPLRHPQQWAKAFNFCLGDGYHGSDFIIDREAFLPPEVIEKYVQLRKTTTGKEVLGWSMPTAAFTLRATVRVANRVEGPEFQSQGNHITTYPIGTRLGDIEVHEPTIGCPGNQLAYKMWEQAIDVITSEGLWTAQ